MNLLIEKRDSLTARGNNGLRDPIQVLLLTHQGCAGKAEAFAGSVAKYVYELKLLVESSVLRSPLVEKILGS